MSLPDPIVDAHNAMPLHVIERAGFIHSEYLGGEYVTLYDGVHGMEVPVFDSEIDEVLTLEHMEGRLTDIIERLVTAREAVRDARANNMIDSFQENQGAD